MSKKFRIDELIEVIHISASESTTHGLDRIFKRKNPLIKLFWLSCFMLSAAACLYMIVLNITSYLNYDTVTRAQQIFLSSAEFPAVTVCNLNAFSSNKSIDFIEKLLVDNKIVSDYSSNESLGNVLADKLLIYKYLTSANALEPNLTDEFRKSLGYELKDMLITCLYNLSPCSADDFVWFHDIVFGNCYVFNGGMNS